MNTEVANLANDMAALVARMQSAPAGSTEARDAMHQFQALIEHMAANMDEQAAANLRQMAATATEEAALLQQNVQRQLQQAEAREARTGEQAAKAEVTSMSAEEKQTLVAESRSGMEARASGSGAEASEPTNAMEEIFATFDPAPAVGPDEVAPARQVLEMAGENVTIISNVNDLAASNMFIDGSSFSALNQGQKHVIDLDNAGPGLKLIATETLARDPIFFLEKNGDPLALNDVEVQYTNDLGDVVRVDAERANVEEIMASTAVRAETMTAEEMDAAVLLYPELKDAQTTLMGSSILTGLFEEEGLKGFVGMDQPGMREAFLEVKERVEAMRQMQVEMDADQGVGAFDIHMATLAAERDARDADPNARQAMGLVRGGKQVAGAANLEGEPHATEKPPGEIRVDSARVEEINRGQEAVLPFASR